MKDSEVLQKALDLMGPNGENWQQLRPGLAYSPQKSCMLIAINRAQEALGIFVTAIPYAAKLGFSSYTQATDFNDAPGRTYPEVRELFEKQIAFAKVLERGNEIARAGC